MKSVPVIVGRIASVKAARVTQVRLNASATIIVPQKPNHKPNGSNQTIRHKQPSERRKRQRNEAYNVDQFLPEFPHRAPHHTLVHRQVEPIKPPWRPQ